jgi:hypothetical protein
MNPPTLAITTIYAYALAGFGVALGWHSFAIVVNALSGLCEYIAMKLLNEKEN